MVSFYLAILNLFLAIASLYLTLLRKNVRIVSLDYAILRKKKNASILNNKCVFADNDIPECTATSLFSGLGPGSIFCIHFSHRVESYKNHSNQLLGESQQTLI